MAAAEADEDEDAVEEGSPFCGDIVAVTVAIVVDDPKVQV